MNSPFPRVLTSERPSGHFLGMVEHLSYFLLLISYKRIRLRAWRVKYNSMREVYQGQVQFTPSEGGLMNL